MRLLLALLCLAAALAPTAFAQPGPLSGDWDGAISIGTVTLDITVTFAENATATIDIPQQGAMGLPLQNVAIDLPTVRFELPSGLGLAIFDGTRDEDTIAGTFTQGTAAGSFSITWQDPTGTRDASTEVGPLPPGVSAEDVSLSTPSGTLHGTLTWPTEGGSVPAALIVSGSGPTDRDGNSTMFPGKNNSLRMLAEALAAEGYAVLRVDKRGVGASAGIDEPELRVQVYVDDLVAWAQWLRGDLRTTNVLTVVGHSEGALIGALAANAVGAEAFVALAGLGRPIQDVLRRQLAPQLTPDLLEQTDVILASLVAGTPTNDVP
ncbi:MAG: alpha/beta fold hydrolase, partial [Bacteroidota bacterium]